MGQAMLDDLEAALGQNRWVSEILERFEEVALPDAWLVSWQYSTDSVEFGVRTTCRARPQRRRPHLFR